MGILCSKLCLAKGSRNKSIKERTKFTNQYLTTENSSSCDANLTNELGQENDTCKKPGGIGFKNIVRKKPVIRIGSWNLNNLDVEKLKKPGVLAVICLTILENNLSILALQEITNKEVAALICLELNKPQLTEIKQQRNSRQWGYMVSETTVGKAFQANEFGVLIYDKSKKIEILRSNQIASSKKLNSLSRNSFLINMKIETTQILMVILHAKATTLVDKISRSSNVTMALKEMIKPDHKVIILGDFNQHPNHESLDPLKNEGYMYCINAEYEKSFDNIWINKACKELYTGTSGVIREAPNHSPISKTGMPGCGDLASDRCAVWVDIFTHL